MTNRSIIFVFFVIILTAALIGVVGRYFAGREDREMIQNTVPTPSPSVVTLPTASTTSTQPTKLYRNEEWGFEFEYPEDWTFETNSFYSPSSKFNLQGNSTAKNYNTLIPSFLINIVTPDFADRQFSDLRNVVSEISVGGIAGLKYEYEMQYGSYEVVNITIILPLNQYKMILRMHKEQESIFNQILASFKFFQPQESSDPQ